MLEMLLDSESALFLIDACQGLGVSVWAGLSAVRNEDGVLIAFRRPYAYTEMQEESLFDLISQVSQAGVDAMGIMHTDITVLREAMPQLNSLWHGFTFASPETGRFEAPNWVYDEDMPLETLATSLSTLAKEQNIDAIGGCCGTNPEYIARLSNLQTSQT